jgi:putative chitinase
MLNLSERQLALIIPRCKYVSEWYEALQECLSQEKIDTSLRLAAFLAQCGHESADFNILKENLNYRAATLVKTWPKHFPNLEIANQYAHKPVAIANRAYANRMGNGSESSGDGFRYSGKGLIQLTGKNNYQLFSAYIGVPIEDSAEYILTFEGAVKSACWFWNKNNLNQTADNGDLVRMTKIINGGNKGLDDRINRYKNALKILRG